MVDIGDEWEEVVAAQVGRERAHAVRLATTWGLGRRFEGQPECR
jgi:hypothetical protein